MPLLFSEGVSSAVAVAAADVHGALHFHLQPLQHHLEMPLQRLMWLQLLLWRLPESTRLLLTGWRLSTPTTSLRGLTKQRRRPLHTITAIGEGGADDLRCPMFPMPAPWW